MENLPKFLEGFYMKKEIKKTLVISILGIFLTLIIIGSVFAKENFGKVENSKQLASKETAVTQLKNVPETQEELLRTTKEKPKTTAVNAAKKKAIAAVKKDTTPPAITAPEISLTQGSAFSLLDYASAIDDTDGDLSKKIVASNTVDTSVIGTQTVSLSVTDTSGNSVNVQQLVHIVEPELAPAEKTTPESDISAAPQTAAVNAPAVQPMTMIIAGQTIPYQNGGQGSGQSIIDANTNGVAATWGGAAVQSAADGMNTHFIGHNPGIFSAVFALGTGSQITVTDSLGTPSVYTVQTVLHVDDQGVGINDGQNYWDLIVGTGGGERITLQTCVNDTVNVIVIAYK